MRRGLLALLLTLELAGGLGCSHGRDHDVTRARCSRALSHLIDLRLARVGTAKEAAAHGIDLAKHRAAMKAALGDRFVATCTKSYTPTKLDCILHAHDSAAATRCKAHPAGKQQ